MAGSVCSPALLKILIIATQSCLQWLSKECITAHTLYCSVAGSLQTGWPNSLCAAHDTIWMMARIRNRNTLLLSVWVQRGQPQPSIRLSWRAFLLLKTPLELRSPKVTTNSWEWELYCTDTAYLLVYPYLYPTAPASIPINVPEHYKRQPRCWRYHHCSTYRPFICCEPRWLQWCHWSD